jgi:hypothetical protein
MLNLIHNAPAYRPTAFNKPVPVMSNQRGGSEQEILGTLLRKHPDLTHFFYKHPELSAIATQLNHLLVKLPDTFPLASHCSAENPVKSRLTTTYENSNSHLILTSKLEPLGRFLREMENREPKKAQEFLTNKFIDIAQEVNKTQEIQKLENKLRVEFPNIDNTKLKYQLQENVFGPLWPGHPGSLYTTYSMLGNLKIITRLPKNTPESHPNLLGLHAQLINKFSEKLGVNRKSLE